MRKSLKLSVAVLVVLCLCACMGPKGNTSSDKRSFVNKMATETLQRLYNEQPESRAQMNSSVGYAVFSSINTNLFLFSSASGFGVADAGGKKTYMKMYSLGVGPGLGVKDYKIVFMFRNKNTMNKFVEKGWEFGGHADAAAKGSDKGDAVGGQISVDSDIVIYTLTEAGVALQATVAGTKYWKDKELN